MSDELNPKQMRRDDAIYNPIEGKWEKRSLRAIDNQYHPIRENKAKLEEIKTTINHFKKNEVERSSARTAASSNIIKRMADMPVKKLKDTMHQQNLHDQMYSQTSEEELKEDKKDYSMFIFKLIVGAILLLIASVT